jgi:hypothetical protein
MQDSPFKFLGAAAATFTLLLVVVAATNYHYDPANIFGDHSYERGVAKLLSEGKDVANVSDYDERLVQKFVAERMVSAPEVLVMGSSRAMNISADFFPGKHFYNAAVSGASLEDDYAILQVYKEHRLTPRFLVLGVDPWIFNRDSQQLRWKSLEPEYLRAISSSASTAKTKLIDKARLAKFLQLISFDYFQASLKSAGRSDRNYFPTKAPELDVHIRRADGTITYKRDYALRSPEKVTDWVHQQTTKTPIYSLGNFKELDPEYRSQFSALITGLKANGTQVVIFLAPYHPDMYAALTHSDSPYRRVIEVEKYLREFAKTQDLQLVGSYDPAKLACDRNSFYDEMHPKPECLANIITKRAPMFEHQKAASAQGLSIK